MPENRLIHEKSPYLLQHAHNPVDWYAWGEEAFERARTEDKPIFLSVGYSTCHWCHVMERESFEDEAIAALLNRHFVCIKVDREERPDVDRIYMAYIQASTGSGGWPMSVWLTPELKPFVGGTYFPPENRYGRPGFPTIIERIAEAWQRDRDKIVTSSGLVMEQLGQQLGAGEEGALPGAEALDSGFNVWRRSFDPTLGGFGGAPKFPRPAILNFLLRYYARTKEREALDMACDTLRAMARGGMHDQLGGGFHRYSVDEYWFVPHFEKMLYDQAQLAASYLEAFQITRDPLYAGVARSTLDYVLRDMTGAEGGFYSAEDADSVIDAAHPEEKGEGAFYVWTQAELEHRLKQPASRWFEYRYGVEDNGNVRNDPHGEFAGHNILFEAHTLEETAHHLDEPIEAVSAALDRACATLLAARAERVRPHLDDKILTAWNGLMISAFAKAAAILDEPRYEQAARRAIELIRARLYDAGSGQLLRRFRGGEVAIPAFLDDYAFLVQALLDSYEAFFHFEDLEWAVTLTERMRELFEDREHGAFFSTPADDEHLPLRMKDDHDGAEPSANSIAALNLLRLSQITGRAELRESGERTLRAFAGRIASGPGALPQMLVAVDYALAPSREIVLAGEAGSSATRAMLQAIYGQFVPARIVLLADAAHRERLAAWNPAIAEMHARDGQTAAYVCENYACRLPVFESSALAQLLQ